MGHETLPTERIYVGEEPMAHLRRCAWAFIVKNEKRVLYTLQAVFNAA